MAVKKYKSIMPEVTLKYRKGNVKKVKISSSSDVYEIAMELFNQDTLEINEEFIALYLNASNNTIAWFKVSQGGITGTVVDVRHIIKTALDTNAVSIILMHNHPSGNCTPSQNDINRTREVVAAAKLFNIRVHDHIIVTDDNGYFSMSDKDII